MALTGLPLVKGHVGSSASPAQKSIKTDRRLTPELCGKLSKAERSRITDHFRTRGPRGRFKMASDSPEEEFGGSFRLQSLRFDDDA